MPLWSFVFTFFFTVGPNLCRRWRLVLMQILQNKKTCPGHIHPASHPFELSVFVWLCPHKQPSVNGHRRTLSILDVTHVKHKQCLIWTYAFSRGYSLKTCHHKIILNRGKRFKGTKMGFKMRQKCHKFK